VKALSSSSMLSYISIKAANQRVFCRAQEQLNTRHSDLLFLAFHKEKPSPNGANVSLLLQQVNHLS